MKRSWVMCVLLMALIGGVLFGCSPQSPKKAAPTVIVEREAVVQEQAAESPKEAPATMAAPAAGAGAYPPPAEVPADQASIQGQKTGVSARPNRLIIKNADLTLEVADTDIAIDRATQVVADVGGYIINSSIQYKDSWKYGTLTIGVPVDNFELALRKLRLIAERVKNETATGQDVTDEYVDMDSRLKNLQATRDRISSSARAAIAPSCVPARSDQGAPAASARCRAGRRRVSNSGRRRARRR